MTECIEEKRIYRGVVFDLDGTLLDTLDDLKNSVNDAVEPAGKGPYTRDEIRMMVGDGFRKLVERAMEGRELWEVDTAFDAFVASYGRRYCEETRPYEGIRELLEQLMERGIPVGINSNKRDDYTNALIRKHFPELSFVEVIGEREEFGRKPNPAAALFLAEKMGLCAQEVLYVGDSKTDMMTGKNAGMGCGGVLWGFRDREELLQYGAGLLVEEPAELLSFLEGT